MLRFFLRLGIFGLFLLSALDSSFLVLPFGNDLLLIALVSSGRSSLRWIAYVLVSVFGSLVGVFIVDVLMRKAGEKGLERFLNPRKIEKFKRKVENKAGISVFIATLLPPPFPFKLFVITAGVFRLSVVRFAIAIAAGRAFRFFLEGFLAVRYGEQAGELLKKNYPMVGLGVAALVVLVFVVRGLLSRRGKRV